MCPLSGTGGSLAGARGPVIDCLRVCGETRLSGNASEACKHRSAGWDEPSHFAGLCNECNRGLSCQGAFILKGDISPPVSCRLYWNLQVMWSTCMCISCAAIISAYLADKSRYLCMCLPIFHSSQKPFSCRLDVKDVRSHRIITSWTSYPAGYSKKCKFRKHPFWLFFYCVWASPVSVLLSIYPQILRLCFSCSALCVIQRLFWIEGDLTIWLFINISSAPLAHWMHFMFISSNTYTLTHTTACMSDVVATEKKLSSLVYTN